MQNVRRDRQLVVGVLQAVRADVVDDQQNPIRFDCLAHLIETMFELLDMVQRVEENAHIKRALGKCVRVEICYVIFNIIRAEFSNLFVGRLDKARVQLVAVKSSKRISEIDEGAFQMSVTASKARDARAGARHQVFITEVFEVMSVRIAAYELVVVLMCYVQSPGAPRSEFPQLIVVKQLVPSVRGCGIARTNDPIEKSSDP